MRWRYVLKMLGRSRSLDFALKAARVHPSRSLARLRWNGREVFYRPGTSDPGVLYQNLLRRGKKAEYYLPGALNPEVILDIGSNIGGSILYFSRRFPNARIFGFEPHPKTFAVLQRNVAELPGVSVFNYGLGGANQKVTIPFDGINFGRFGHGAPPRIERPIIEEVECEIRHAGEVLQTLGMTRVDLLKIDCEGAEADVFAALPRELVAQCKWIVGEMHDASAFQILEKLAPHFDLDMRRTMFNACFRFHACNLALAPELKGTFESSALQR